MGLYATGRVHHIRLLESLANLHDVRDFLGHANITRTTRYLRSAPVRLAETLGGMEASSSLMPTTRRAVCLVCSEVTGKKGT